MKKALTIFAVLAIVASAAWAQEKEEKITQDDVVEFVSDVGSDVVVAAKELDEKYSVTDKAKALGNWATKFGKDIVDTTKEKIAEKEKAE